MKILKRSACLAKRGKAAAKGVIVSVRSGYAGLKIVGVSEGFQPGRPFLDAPFAFGVLAKSIDHEARHKYQQADAA